jgi:hypothetical protein
MLFWKWRLNRSRLIMKNRQPSLIVHTNPEFETSNLILDFEFDQHLESHKHVINIIMGFRDMGCYTKWFCDTSTEAATGAACCGSFIGGDFGLLVASYG